MEEINFEDFLRIQIRTGTILEATLNTKARNPAYILKIDFGHNPEPPFVGDTRNGQKWLVRKFL